MMHSGEMFFLDFPILPQDVHVGQVDKLTINRYHAAWYRSSAWLFCETSTVTVSDIQ